MALPSTVPSSPPPVVDLDGIEVEAWPDWAEAEHHQQLPTATTTLPSRKRQLSDYGSGSSDPVFSEDASEGDASHYEQAAHRRKRWVRGPWWNHRRSSGLSLRRSMLKRGKIKAADSGIWMGSDASDDAAESSSNAAEWRMEPDVQKAAQSELPAAERLALVAVQKCVDEGQESVDLSDMGLEDLSNSTLRPLRQLIRNPQTDLPLAPSEEEFRSLTPSIQLYLSGNRLTCLPPELFNLSNLTVLSLRNNSLTSIPAAICRLNNLEELNVSQNCIEHLPWELSHLIQSKGSRRRIIVRPNPLIAPTEINGPYPLPRPNTTPSELTDALSKWGEINGAFHNKMRQWYQQEGVPWGTREELELRLKLGRTRRGNYVQEASRGGEELKLSEEPLIYLASSAISYLDVDGSLIRSPGSPFGGRDFSANLEAAEPPPVDSRAHAVPSLLELGLRRIQMLYNASELQNIPETLPPSLRAGLSAAHRSIEYGSDRCTRCSRECIIPRAEWMEYWFNGFPSQRGLTQESILPFLRRACSWRCAVPTELGGFRF